MTGNHSSTRSAMWVFAALGAIVLGVALLLVAPRLGNEALAPTNPSEVVDSGRESAIPKPFVPAASGNSERSEPTDITAPTPQPPPDRILRDDTRRVVLHVVNERGESIAGAAVSFLVDTADPYEIHSPYRKQSPSKLSETDWTEAESLVTGADGTVLLPFFENAARVRATSDKRMGRRSLTARHIGRKVPLELFADRSLEIVVVDTEGDPVADVPVGIFQRVDMGRRAGVALWRGKTRAPDGIAVVPHAQAFDPNRLYAALALPVKEGVERDLEPTDLPEEPIRLVLPETGSMTIRLVDHEGLPYTESAVFYLGARPPFNSGAFTVEETAPQGVLEVPFVEAGLTFQCSVSPLNDAHGTTEAHIAGPAAAGDHEEKTVRLGEPLPAFSAMLVDGTGAPLANRKFHYRLSAPGAPNRWFGQTGDGTTDASGRTLTPFHESALARNRRDEPYGAIELTVGETDATDSQPRWRGGSPFTMPESGDVAELGRIVLDEVPFLVAGSVIDMNGAPLPGVRVSVKASQVHAMTDDGGRFRIQHSGEGLARELQAFRQGHRVQGKTVAFEPGDEDIVIQLFRVTSVTGRVLLPRGLERRITIKLKLPSRERQLTTVDGYFSLLIPEGPISIEFSLPGESQPCHIIGPMDVTKGAVNELGDIDLRPMLHIFRLRVADENGEAVEGARIYSDGRTPYATSNQQGEITLLSCRPMIDAEISADGYATNTMPITTATQEVIIRSGSKVEIRLAPDSGRVPPGYRLSCSVRANRRATDNRSRIQRTDEHQSAETYFARFVVSPGPHTASWSLSRADGTRQRTTVGSPFEFEAEQAGRQLFERTITDAQFADAVDRLEGQ